MQFMYTTIFVEGVQPQILPFPYTTWLEGFKHLKFGRLFCLIPFSCISKISELSSYNLNALFVKGKSQFKSCNNLNDLRYADLATVISKFSILDVTVY